MSLSVGIVGLPNVGKSTLFNALLKKQAAFAANYPFATIEPNIGIVPVPDERLEKLADVIARSTPGESSSATPGESRRPPQVSATVEFVDIAGLVAGASKGEGLGNKFLAHIREVNVVCHVLRAFCDPDIVRSGSTNPKSDFETVKTELELADLETVEKRQRKEKKGEIKEELHLLAEKPILIVLNVDEEDLKNASSLEESTAKELGVDPSQVIAVCAKTESDLAGLTPEEQTEYLEDIGVVESGLNKLIKRAYKTLDLMSFLTAGEKEVRAWTIKNGTDAPTAAGTIHTDFAKKFIKADVVTYDDFLEFRGWRECREHGKVRIEGRDYIVKDGDVIEFKIGI